MAKWNRRNYPKPNKLIQVIDAECELCFDPAVYHAGRHLCKRCYNLIDWDDWKKGAWTHTYENVYIHRQMIKIFEQLPDEVRAFFIVKRGPIEDLYGHDIFG